MRQWSVRTAPGPVARALTSLRLIDIGKQTATRKSKAPQKEVVGSLMTRPRM
jgi:hypothetical protein